jgi:hypothetical protein
VNLRFHGIYNKRIWRPDLVNEFVAHCVVFIDAKCKSMVVPELTKVKVDHELLEIRK